MSGPEILVHAAAPSRGSDDARYRKEAVGILEFEAVKRHNVLPRKVQVDEGGRGLRSWIAQDAQQALGQDSVTSTDPAPHHHLSGALTTWVTPILTRPSPRLLVGRTPAPSFYERTSSLSGDLQIKRTPVDQYRPRTAPSGPGAIQVTPRLRHSFSDSFETPPSIIPDSQPILSSQDRSKRPFEEFSSPSPTHRQSPDPKRAKADVGEELEDWTQPEDTSTPPLNNLPQQSSSPSPSSPKVPPPYSTTHTPASAIHEDQCPRYRYRRRQLLPPHPKPGNQPFSTHLTPNLILLRKATTRILQTVKPRRAISPLERGHWRFTIPEDDNRWTRAAKEEMWKFLTNFIQGGSGGWGVWAVFEERRLSDENDFGEGGEDGHAWQEHCEENDNEGRAGGTVKVYCWGEVVPEIYTVLFTATGRKVKNCGAQWIDAGGHAVVDMGTA